MNKCVLLVQPTPWLAQLVRLIGWRSGRFHNICLAWSVSDNALLLPRARLDFDIDRALWTNSMGLLFGNESGFLQVQPAQMLVAEQDSLSPTATALQALSVATDASLDTIAEHLRELTRTRLSLPKRIFAAWISASGDVTIAAVGRPHLAQRNRYRRRRAWLYPFQRRRQRGYMTALPGGGDVGKIPPVRSLGLFYRGRHRNGEPAAAAREPARHRYLGRHRWRLASMWPFDRATLLERTFGMWAEPLLSELGHGGPPPASAADVAPSQFPHFGRSIRR